MFITLEKFNYFKLFFQKPALILLLIIIIMPSACSDAIDDTHDHPQDFTGKDYYEYHCAGCHKSSGMGQVMDGVPPVFYTKLTHSQLRKMITGAHAENSNMPSFKNMPKDEARKISRYLTQLRKQRDEL